MDTKAAFEQPFKHEGTFILSLSCKTRQDSPALDRILRRLNEISGSPLNEILSDDEIRVRMGCAASAVILVDAGFKILLVNAQTEKLLGIFRNNLTGKPLIPCLPGCLRAPVSNFYRKSLNNSSEKESKSSVSFNASQKNGNFTLYQIKFESIRIRTEIIFLISLIQNNSVDSDNETSFPAQAMELTTAVEDRYELLQINTRLKEEIAKREEVEEALRESEEKFRTIVHTASEGIWILDRKNATTFVNNTLAEMLGYRLEEIKEKSFFDFLNTEGQRIIETHIQLKMPDIGEKHYLKMRHKSGDYIWTSVALKPLYEKKNKFVGTMVLVTNVTERKQAEIQIRKLSSAVEQSASIIIITDIKGRIEYVNSKFCEVTGFDKDDVLGKNPRILRGDKTTAVDYKELWQTIAAGREWRGELHNKKKDNTYYWVYATISPIKNSEGAITHYLGVQEDITERKAAELELKRYSQELERSNRELQQFAYVASHDLQEPLRMISSYMTLLKRRYEGQLGGDADDFINFAVDGAKRMKQLINDLLQYSRVGTHKKPFTFIDLNDILNQVLLNLQVCLQENDARVTHDPLPQIMADDIQLTQLFQNLISNALKFRKKEPPNIHIGSSRKNGLWQFSVKDNGIGIEAEFASRIFIIFQRLHRMADYPGTGIGLAICKKIVERHGGEIWVESVPGEGSTFHFTIPVNHEFVHDN